MKKLIFATVAAIPFVTGGVLPTSAQQNAVQNQGVQQQSTIGQPKTSQSSDAAVSLNPTEIRHMQEALTRAGFGAGRDDGVMGPRTEHALRDFQEGNGLHATGTADRETIVALSVDAFNAQPATERAGRPAAGEPGKQSSQSPTTDPMNSNPAPQINK